MKEFKTVLDLTCNLHLIPETVSVDVLKRIVDWMISDGSLEDQYVINQLQYASKFIKEA